MVNLAKLCVYFNEFSSILSLKIEGYFFFFFVMKMCRNVPTMPCSNFATVEVPLISNYSSRNSAGIFLLSEILNVYEMGP